MKNLILLFVFMVGMCAAHAEQYPAASVGYVRDVFAKTGLCQLRNSVHDSVAANMEYLMNAIDICNRGITQYAKSEYASHQMANTDAVNQMTDVLYVSDGLLISLGADNVDDWIAAGDGIVELLPDGIKLIKEDLRTRDTIDLSPYQNITVELRFRLEEPENLFLFEHSSDWNSQRCGFGFAINLRTSAYEPDEIHSNPHMAWVNYKVKTTDLKAHTVVKIFTTIDSAHHLSFYDGEKLENPVVVNNGSSLFCSPFRNDFFHIGHRTWQPVSDSNVVILHSLRIYNRALTAAEVCHNAWVDFRRFGGARPDCMAPASMQ